MSNQFKSLISLLDDPDDEVYENVFQKLCELGPAIIPTLESEWEHNLDEIVQTRLENLIHTIQFDFVKAELKVWALNENNNLQKGLLIINKYLYPDADDAKIIEQLELLKKNIWIELNYQLTPMEQVGVFNTIFFKHLKFEANAENVHEPKNNFLGHVLETKKGNPIGLGVLYLLLAQQLHMPVFGVCLKNYFVLCFIDTEVFNADTGMINSKDILFYINPFNKGAIFYRQEIITYLLRINQAVRDKYFHPAYNIDILEELLTVIYQDYQQQGQKEKVEEVLELRKMLGK